MPAEVAAFSADYFEARERFRAAADRAGWQRFAYPIDALGPAGERLTMDVAMSSSDRSEPVVLASSGVHGVEGFFGSAIQLEALAQLETRGVRCVFIHGVNPYGFAHLRRADENGVDLNRNFRLDGEPYQGSWHYAELDHLLNPKGPPRKYELFSARAFANVLVYGLPKLRQAIASGQYDFPRGLFFGGHGPSQVHAIIREHLPDWLGDAREVVHLDFHTGLGPWGSHKLLIDPPLTADQMARATDWFGRDVLQPSQMDGVAYESHGGFGPWCAATQSHRDYLFLCAEFGTYHNVKMLAGIRDENRAHHWGNGPDDPLTVWAKLRLKELFSPADPQWRTRVVTDGVALIRKAADGLRSR